VCQRRRDTARALDRAQGRLRRLAAARRILPELSAAWAASQEAFWGERLPDSAERLATDSVAGVRLRHQHRGSVQTPLDPDCSGCCWRIPPGVDHLRAPEQRACSSRRPSEPAQPEPVRFRVEFKRFRESWVGECRQQRRPPRGQHGHGPGETTSGRRHATSSAAPRRAHADAQADWEQHFGSR